VKKSWRNIKLLLINAFVLLMLILSVNLISSLILDGASILRSLGWPINNKANVASLSDRDLARLVYREKKQLKTRYEPYLGWSRRPFSGETTTVNREGDRTHPLVSATPTKHARFFGGSTIWGSGVDDSNTIPAHFNALFPDYHVHNHGEAGFVSRQGLARLVNLVNQGAPMDLVVFYDGCNDSRSLCRADVAINGHREQAKMSRKLEHGWHTLNHLIGSIQNLIREIKKGERPPSKCLEDPNYARRVASTMVNNWRIAKLVAELGGAEFHAVLQPVAELGSPNLEYMTPGGGSTEFRVVYQFVWEIVRREKIAWIHDFTDAFDVDEYIYIDGCHVNGYGNHIIAEKLRNLLGRRDTANTSETLYSSPSLIAQSQKLEGSRSYRQE
jgi:hypothetical protein